MVDLNDMVYFAEVAERGGFAAAGRALGVPKSRLSRRVAELEAQLDVQLLQRSTRSLSLTPAGELYLRHCAAMRDAAQAAGEAIAQVQTEPRGTIRISCPVTVAQSSVGRLLPVFMSRYPAVRVEMMVINRPVDPIEEGVDIAIRVRAAIENSATLVAKNFGVSRGVLVANAGLVRARGPIETPAHLGRLDTMAMSASGDGRQTWHLEGPGGAAYVHQHSPRLVADDLATLVSAAVEGVGAAVLPDYMCSPHLRSGELVGLLPGWGPPPGICHAMFPARRALVPAVRKLIDFLAANLDGAEMRSSITWPEAPATRSEESPP